MRIRNVKTRDVYDNGIYQHVTDREFSLVYKDKAGTFRKLRGSLRTGEDGIWFASGFISAGSASCFTDDLELMYASDKVATFEAQMQRYAASLAA